MKPEATEAELAFVYFLHGRAMSAIREEWGVSHKDMKDGMAAVPGYVDKTWLDHWTWSVSLRCMLERRHGSLAPDTQRQPLMNRTFGAGELQQPKLTANGLAASFSERVNEHGWTWITAKQLRFLRSLIGREHPEHVDRGGSVTRTGIVTYRQHGWPIIEGPGWQVTEYHNGSGLFKVTE